MISLIWAMDINNLIGKDNALPWYYPEDLRYFKKQTLHQDVLMGYNTFLSIFNRLNKPLPNRNNFVLSYEKLNIDGVSIVQNLQEFLERYENSEQNLFVIGGKSVYDQLLDKADFLYITLINKAHEGNVYFSKIDYSNYELIQNDVCGELSFLIYKKVK